jgi:hypothetical protein
MRRAEGTERLKRTAENSAVRPVVLPEERDETATRDDFRPGSSRERRAYLSEYAAETYTTPVRDLSWIFHHLQNLYR